MTAVDLSRLVAIENIRGEDDQDTASLREMAGRAQSYLLSYPWCASTGDAYLGFGVGDVAAVFLFRARLKSGAEELLWVIEGDLPSAYLVTDQARTPADALETYSGLMQEWVRAVRTGADSSEVFPVDVPANGEYASMLEKRIELLRRDIIPAARQAFIDAGGSTQ
jgi:hypothetical protein